MSKIKEAYNTLELALKEKGMLLTVSSPVSQSMKILKDTVVQVEKLLVIAEINDILPKTEMRVYLVRYDEITEEAIAVMGGDKDTNPMDFPDELFMDEAERQGYVYTLDYFETCFNNNDEINQDGDYIRFFNVPVV